MLEKDCQLAHAAFAKICAVNVKNGNSDILSHPYVKY